jgi:hypothetical protein
MKGGGRMGRVEFAIALDSLVRRQRLDLHAPFPQLLERPGFGSHLRVGTGTHQQALGQLLEHVSEVGEDEDVPICTPPVRDEPAGQQDHVSCLLFAVNNDATEAVFVDRRHNTPIGAALTHFLA